MDPRALGVGGDSDQLLAQLRKSWIVAVAVSPLIGPLTLAIFRGTSFSTSSLLAWSLGHVVLGVAAAGALIAESNGRTHTAIRLDWFYRIGMVGLFGALPWCSPGSAGAEPDLYILAVCMVVSSAGGTLTVIQFSGRRRPLIALVAAGNVSYTVAYFASGSLVMGLIALLWTVVSAVMGVLAANVAVELIRLRTKEAIAARHDDLTGLLNRQGFFDELAEVDDRATALAIIDLDRFKLINDSLGHQAGDHVLQEVAMRLAAYLGPEAAIARIGGDEFAAIVPCAGPVVELKPVFDQLLTELEQPIELDGRKLRVGGSIGVTAVDGQRSPSESFAQADLSMYQSKRSDAQAVTFFDRSLQEQLTRRVELEQRFREALTHGSITFWGQVVVRSADLEPIGLELLARWRDADGTMISPGEFIPVAEEAGLTTELGRLALDRAVELLDRWHGDPDLGHIEVNVNISTAHLGAGLVDDVIARRPAPDDRLGIEFVETGLISAVGDENKLEELRAAGARLVIDDFGVGYSSLSYLWSLPIDTLKIDRAFIEGILTDPVRHQVVAAISQMAGALSIPCVAEGVESLDVVPELHRLGIEQFQGFAVSRPEPLDRAEATVRRLLREAAARRVAPAPSSEAQLA